MNFFEPAFLTSPRFEDLTEGGETQKLKLLDDLKVFSAYLNAFIDVPKGFVFEESIPTCLFSIARPRGESKRAACIHDWLYRNGSYMNASGSHKVSRRQADNVYFEFLVCRGVSKARAYMRWLSVRIGGFSSWKGQ